MDSRENKQKAAQSGSQSQRSPFVMIGTIVILVIVVIAFVFAPLIEAAVGSSSELNFTFGSYDGEDITLANGNYFANQISVIQQNYSREQMSDIFAIMQIYRQAFDNTVIHTAKMKEMEKAGFVLPNSMVDKAIISLPNFQQDGVFSATAYNATPSDRRMIISNSIKEQITSGTYDRVMGNLRISANERKFIDAMNNSVRSFEMASLPISAYPAGEVRSFAENNPDLFKQIHLSVITLNSSQRDANNLLESIKKGTSSFEDAARNRSNDAYAGTGGDMGIKIAYELNAEIPLEYQQSIFSLANGELSSVIQVPNGWAFYRMEESAQSLDLNNADNLARVRSYITGYERGRMDDWLIERADAFIAAADRDRFSETAAALAYEGFKTNTFGPLPLNYGNSEVFAKISESGITELSYAANDINFWTHAFKTPINTISEPMIVGDNVIILRPTSETIGTENAEAEENVYLTMLRYPSVMNFAVNQNFGNQIRQSGVYVDNFVNTYLGLIQ